ncbi:BolA/IbaG family iron-sulfur metabolism protein [Methylophaga sp.]|jgi:acid stress-induced BolA-like protein IbaG/YrbA|uniref:BolA family protein n=1 Tax=Methylophaga sp. TaxID=2024840 RepID=UPI0013FF3C51|nr:BolA/IbaG family iron-sulfur metabolism protein [Methylophaga sp.]MTI64147.1 BolA/IbaG family iron-sulfur metabolism protein [Methylophaga sp.]
MKASEIKALIEAGLPDADVEVKGDDGQHFDAVVVSPSFVGKSLIEQHKMVKATLGDRFTSGELHALGLKTSAPR